ncbi:MAG: hypothetical protein MUF79_12115 [Burkholderiales bacterium]|jgi:hypothetical protein|nr:hypothetical protein [Burkholderiales bacterium]
MSDKRVLYLTSSLLTAYRVRRGAVELDARFPENDDGLAAFDAYVKGLGDALVLFLADVVEEDFQQETIPFVRGADRRALLERRVAQRYRDTSLSLVQSLGTTRGQRREERLLLSAFTNTQAFLPWLGALREAGVTVVGVYSVGQLAPRLARATGRKQGQGLVITLDAAGLRQSYVEDLKLRFSRLSPLSAADVASPERTAAAFARETARLQQYLVSSRSMASEGEKLDALMVTPPGLQAAAQRDIADNGLLAARVMDLQEAMAAIGLRQRPPDAGAEVLYVYLVATSTPREQYAREALRGRYRVHQVRNAILAAGGALFAAGLAVAGYDAVAVFRVHGAMEQDQQLLAQANEQYSRITARFPAMSTTTESLRVTMTQYAELTRQSVSAEPLLAEVSQALQLSPRIELDSIRWERSDTLPPASGAAGKAPPAAGAAQQAGPYESATITGRVLAARASEYRNITNLVNEFIENLKRRPGIEVVGSRLPFDVGSQTSLSGDIGTDRSDVPTFTVTVLRRVGP